MLRNCRVYARIVLDVIYSPNAVVERQFQLIILRNLIFSSRPQNVSMFDGMDACGTNNWQVKDREVGSTSEEKSDVIYEYIPHLKPFTRYAIYVKTYTVAAESTLGGATPITYFVTKPTSKFGVPKTQLCIVQAQ